MLSKNNTPCSHSYIKLFISLRVNKEYDVLNECWNDFIQFLETHGSKIVVEAYYAYVNALYESGYEGKTRAMDIVFQNTYQKYIENHNNNIYPCNLILNSYSYNE